MRLLTIEHLGRPKQRDQDDPDDPPYELPDYDDI
jgi:hypothetical protein